MFPDNGIASTGLNAISVAPAHYASLAMQRPCCSGADVRQIAAEVPEIVDC